MRLPAPPPPQLTLLAFFVTAAIAGWMGFDLAWRYNSIRAASGRGEAQSFPSLEDWLKSGELEGPMFGQPSVESSPLAPIELNKRPKPELDSSNTLPPLEEETPAASDEPEPSPSPETPTPTPEPEPSPSPTSEPAAQPSASDNPEAEVEIDPAPTTTPAPVPEVAPLPPEPTRYSPPTPATPAPEAAQTFASPEPAPSPASLGESVEPPVPSQSGNTSDSSIAPEPAVAEPSVPFPEPATN